MTTYRHTADMGEISGFGGGYEACCQDMLEAGVKYLTNAEHPRNLRLKGFKGVYGLIEADSEDAKALEKVVLDAAKGEATGAMHHAVMSRLLYISKNGWDDYCTKLREREQKDGDQET